MIECVLYNNLSDKQEVNKKLTNPYSTYILLKDSTNVVEPTIILDKESGMKSIPTYNYVKIGGDINRYYYVTEFKSVNNDVWELSLHSDGLMSFKDFFLKLDAIIERTADNNYFDAYIKDNLTITEQRTKIQLKEFPIGFGSPVFLLTTAGGN